MQLDEASNDELIQELRQRLDESEIERLSLSLSPAEMGPVHISLWGIWNGRMEPFWQAICAPNTALEVTFDEPLDGVRGLNMRLMTPR